MEEREQPSRKEAAPKSENPESLKSCILYIECFCPSPTPQIRILKPNSQCDGIRGGVFGR